MNINFFNLFLFTLPLSYVVIPISSNLKLAYIFLAISYIQSKSLFINMRLLNLFFLIIFIFIFNVISDNRIQYLSILDSIFSLGLIFFFLILAFSKMKLNHNLSLSSLRNGILFLFYIGILEFIIFYLFEISISPKNLINYFFYNKEPIIHIYNYGGYSSYRVSSLAIEPKIFGMILAILPIVSLVDRKNFKSLTSKKDVLISFIGVLMSFSSSAIFIFMITTPLIFLKNFINKFSWKLYFALAVLISYLAFYYFVSMDVSLAKHSMPSSVGGIISIFAERVINRIGLEDFDYVSILILKENVQYFWYGGITYYLKFLATPEILEGMWWKVGNHFQPKSGLIYILTTVGLVGYSIFSILLYKFLKFSLRELNNFDKILIIFLLIMFLLRFYLLDIVFLLIFFIKFSYYRNYLN